MNTDDQFESRLQRQPQRPVPPSWRNEILTAARAAAAPRSVPASHQPTWLARLNARLTALFWPHPVAWGGLAAAWLLVFALNAASLEPTVRVATHYAPPMSGEVKELLRQQEQLFAELAGPFHNSEADRPKLVLPSPRSERRVDFANA
jgi:hypothetical protein